MQSPHLTPIHTLESQQLLPPVKPKHNPFHFHPLPHPIQHLPTVPPLPFVPHIHLLDGLVTLSHKLPHRKGHTLVPRCTPTVELDVKGANETLQIADSVLLLEDTHPQVFDLVLHRLDLSRVLAVCLLQLFHKKLSLFLKVVHHELFLLSSVNDDLLVVLGSEVVEQHVVVVRHHRELRIDLFDVLLEELQHRRDLLLTAGLLSQDGEAESHRGVVGVVVGEEFQLVTVHSQGLQLILPPLQHTPQLLLQSLHIRHPPPQIRLTQLRQCPALSQPLLDLRGASVSQQRHFGPRAAP